VGLVLGIDVGTQSLKVVVCDDALGDGFGVRGEASAPIETRRPAPGHAEQDPAAWEAALAPAIGRALAAAGRAPRDVAALGLAGQLDGCVAVGADGRALAPCLIWQDRRAPLPPGLDPAAVQARTGQVLDAGHMAPKIRFLAGALGAAAVRFHQPVSYLVERLTGAAVLDPAHASTTLLYDLAAGTWAADQLAAFGIDPAWLPAIRPAHAIAGALSATGAALTGLPAGVAVAVGTGDDFATPLGAGVIAPGVVACTLGTAEVVGALHGAPVIDPGALVETHAYPAGGWFVEHPGWMSGGALAWLGALLGEPDPAALDALAAPIAPGADGVCFVPALAGAMTPVWDPGMTAAWSGLTAAHGRGHVVRAVLEAMALAERDVIDRLAALGVATAAVLVLGGGGRSSVWTQIRADATGRPHAPAARTDTCAVGAAMLAAVAAGALPDLAAAARRVPPPGAPVLPRAEHAAAYAEAHDRAHRVFAALRAGLAVPVGVRSRT
jgi:xylulokinase